MGVVGLCLTALTACTDSLTSPVGNIDRIAVARVLPSLIDARLRLAGNLNSVAIRQRVILDISDLEIALRSGDLQQSQQLLHKVTSEVTDYRAQSSNSEGADVSAIFLSLQAVSQIVDAGNSAIP